MREIIFRYVLKDLRPDHEGQLIFFFHTLEDLAMGAMANFREDEIISVDQFMGLVDKNKKKIFEGDILKVPSRPDWDNEKAKEIKKWKLGVVKSIHDQWMVQLPDSQLWDNGYSYEDFSNDVPWKESKVIGNIHENPDLLK